jgi:hypothetical protein
MEIYVEQPLADPHTQVSLSCNSASARRICTSTPKILVTPISKAAYVALGVDRWQHQWLEAD